MANGRSSQRQKQKPAQVFRAGKSYQGDQSTGGGIIVVLSFGPEGFQKRVYRHYVVFFSFSRPIGGVFEQARRPEWMKIVLLGHGGQGVVVVVGILFIGCAWVFIGPADALTETTAWGRIFWLISHDI